MKYQIRYKMAYRFTNTDKWNDAWFSELKPIEKLLFNYICDNCDIAGFIEVRIKNWAYDIGTDKPQIEGALKGLARGLIYSNTGDCVFIKNFLKHQKNLPINLNNKAHVGIIHRFDSYKNKFGFNDYNELIEGACKGLQSPIGIGIGNDIGLGNGNGDKKPKFDFKKSLLEIGVSEQVATDWIKVRKDKGASNTETAFKAIKNQIEASQLNPNDSIKYAVEKSWQGFEASWIKNVPNTAKSNKDKMCYFTSKHSGEGMEIHAPYSRYELEVKWFGETDVTFIRYAD